MPWGSDRFADVFILRGSAPLSVDCGGGVSTDYYRVEHGFEPRLNTHATDEWSYSPALWILCEVGALSRHLFVYTCSCYLTMYFLRYVGVASRSRLRYNLHSLRLLPTFALLGNDSSSADWWELTVGVLFRQTMVVAFRLQ